MKLLGSSLSFFQGMCLLGYGLVPLVIASFISVFVKHPAVRFPIDILALAWSVYAASVSIIRNTNLGNRLILAIYPIGLWYFVLAWLTFIT